MVVNNFQLTPMILGCGGRCQVTQCKIWVEYQGVNVIDFEPMGTQVTIRLPRMLMETTCISKWGIRFVWKFFTQKL